MAAIVASKVKRIRKQRDADSQQNLRTVVGNTQINNRGRGDSEFENGGELSPSSIMDKRALVQRQVTTHLRKVFLNNSYNLKPKVEKYIPYNSIINCPSLINQ